MKILRPSLKWTREYWVFEYLSFKPIYNDDIEYIST